jgi:hypothetical protein
MIKEESVMTPRQWTRWFSVLVLALGLTEPGRAGAQYGFPGHIPGYPSVSQFGSGYGANPFSGYGSFGGEPSTGYGVSNGQLGAGYQSAGRLYQQGFQATRPQTTVALQPLYDVITSLPGWSGRAHRARRRSFAQSQPSAPHTALFGADGQILWPSTIPGDPAAAELRRAAEAAVRAVVRESKSTGHASIRPVIDAKNKLTAFERKALPEVKAKNVTDAAALETFFHDLDKALDAMTYTY